MLTHEMKDKQVIVTGGGSGIGLATAKKYIEAGATVIITGRNEDKLKKVCSEINSPLLSYMCWDVSKVETFKEKLEEAERRMGGLNILVNSAGVLTDNDFIGDFWNSTPEDWDYTQSINLKGVFFLCQAIAKMMVERKRKCHIVNVCSETAFRPAKVAYTITKWGIRGMTYGLGKQLAPHNIIVNGVAPGAIATEMMRWKEGDSMRRDSHRNGRFGYPEEIADLIVFLSSDQADNIIGEVVISDGGSHLY